MDNVVGSDQEADLLPGRDHQWTVNLEQIVFAFVVAVIDLFTLCGEQGVILYLTIHVLVVPLPLRPGNQHRKIRFRGIFHGYQGFRGRHCHEYKNKKRNYRPGNFHLHVFMKIRGFGTAGFSVQVHRNKHDSEHHYCYPYANREHQHVEIVYLSTDFRRAAS